MSNQNMNKQYAAMFKQRQAYMNQQANQYIQQRPQQQRSQIQVRQGQSLQDRAAMMRQQEQAILAQKRQQQQQFGMGNLQQQYSSALNSNNRQGQGHHQQQSDGKQALAQATQAMNAKANAELKKRKANEKLRDNLNKDVMRLYYSNKCRHSMHILDIINKAVISADFELVNVHEVSRSSLPQWLKTVPTLLNQTTNECYIDNNLFNWISNYITSNESKNSININGSEVVGNIASELGSSGCGAYYSFLDDVLDESKANNNTIVNVGNSMPSGFELLNTKERIVGFGNDPVSLTNGIKNYNPNQGQQQSNQNNNIPTGLQAIQVSKPKQQYANQQKSQYEQYMAMRNSDTNMLKQYQQRQYQQR